MTKAAEENLDTTFYASLDAKGRLVLPVKLRKKAQVKPGDVLTISLDQNLTLHVSQTVTKSHSLRGLLKSTDQHVSVVDNFLSDRRKEAQGEATEKD